MAVLIHCQCSGQPENLPMAVVIKLIFIHLKEGQHQMIAAKAN